VNASPTAGTTKTPLVRLRVSACALSRIRKRRGLMWMKVNLFGKTILALLDTGATDCFMSSKLVADLNLSMKPFHEPVKMGNQQTIRTVGKVVGAAIKSDYETYTDDIIVLDSPESVLILGMTYIDLIFPQWREMVQSQLNSRTHHRFRRFGDLKRNAMLATLRTEAIKNYTLSALQLKKTLRKKNVELFVCILRALNDDNEDSEAEQGTSTSKPNHGLEERILKVIRDDFPDVFPERLPGLPPARQVEHAIPLTDDKIVYRSQYRLSPKERETLQEQVQEMLALGLIRPSSSGYAAPVLFVKKADGSLRMVIDYRALNKKTVRDRFPLPRIADLLDRLTNARYFSKMDLQQGFYQIRVRAEDVPKTAFFGGDGLYEMLVMPMGMCNSPSTFQRMMRNVIPQHMDSFVCVYLDDILIFSNTPVEHLEHVKQVFQQLKTHKLVGKLSKCEFGRQQIKFVGHIIGDGKRSIDPDRIYDIRRTPPPTTVSEVRQFLGVVNFLRDHLPRASEFAAPLTVLTKKGVAFTWSHVEQSAFEDLKRMIGENISLALPDPSLPYVLETDASLIGLGATLYQVKDGIRVPICFASRKLSSAERNYPTHKRELMAIWWACSNFRHYLEGLRFEVHTDHKALLEIPTQPTLDRQVVRWVDYLQRFDQALIYIKGHENIMADFLSRLPESQAAEEEKIKQLSQLEAQGPYPTDPGAEMDSPDWPLALLSFWEDRLPENTSEEFRQFLVAQAPHFEYDEEEQLLFRKVGGDRGRVPYIPFVNRDNLVERIHSHAHLHWEETFRRLRDRCWWPYMQRDIRKWVERCPICQLHGRIPRQPAAPLAPPQSFTIFQRWAVDHIGPFPLSRNGNRYIIHAKDLATKWEVAEAVADGSAKTLGEFLYKRIFQDYGPPSEILSDRGPNYRAEELRAYLRLQGVHHKMTSAYHPRTNGAIETSHGPVKKALKKACGDLEERWDEYLPMVMFHINRRRNLATGYSPYFLVFGIEPKLPGDLVEPPQFYDPRNPTDVAEFRARALEEFGVTREQARARNEATAAAAKERYDQLVREDPLQVGDWTLLKRGIVMTQGRAERFRPSFIGPFKVVEVCEYGTYRLQEPNGTIKHDLVHRDRLKRCQVDLENPPTELWTDDTLEDYDETEFPTFLPDAVNS